MPLKINDFLPSSCIAPKPARQPESGTQNIFCDPIFLGHRPGAWRGNCMPRTVVQITADPSYLYGLCDDGQIFRLVNHAWQPLAAIPQDDLDGTAKPKSEIDPFKDEQPGG
jgi:hypothetical protein